MGRRHDHPPLHRQQTTPCSLLHRQQETRSFLLQETRSSSPTQTTDYSYTDNRLATELSTQTEIQDYRINATGQADVCPSSPGAEEIVPSPVEEVVAYLVNRVASRLS